jgi:hypothetical protein
VLSGHLSRPTSILFSSDCKELITGGRDKVFLVYDLDKHALKKTNPIYESVEAMAVFTPSQSVKKLLKMERSKPFIFAELIH